MTGIDVDYNLRVDLRHRAARFTIINRSGRSLTLKHRDGQAFDAVVRREGREVWRWSRDKMFTMMGWQQPLDPGQSVEHTIDLPSLPPGTYKLAVYSVAENVIRPPAVVNLDIQ